MLKGMGGWFLLYKRKEICKVYGVTLNTRLIMAQEENTFGKGLIEAIVTEVINKEGSPYKQMMGKVGSIGADYFDGIKMGNVLAKELNVELKARVVERLKRKYEEVMAESGILEKVMGSVMLQTEKAKRGDGREAVNRELLRMANNLRQYANNRLLFVPNPPCQEEELKTKYERAKRITMMEHIMQNNEKDVIDFYRTLISRTEWECRDMVERETSRLLVTIAEKVENMC